MTDNQHKTKRELVRIGKYLNEIISIKDTAGNLLHKVIKPVMVELYPRDIVQLIVGATLLSIPIAFTEEVWTLGQHLPWLNIIMLGGLSITFLGLFVFYNYYRHHFHEHKFEFIKRVLATYIISLAVAWLVLFSINKAPMGAEWLTTLKRMIILAFPASMSAAVADVIK